MNAQDLARYNRTVKPKTAKPDPKFSATSTALCLKTGKVINFGILDAGGTYERVFIKNPGKRTFDLLSWSCCRTRDDDPYVLSIQGVYKGNYRDSEIMPEELAKVLRAIGSTKELESLAAVCKAWKVEI